MKEDARFIAEARTALPRLIEEVRMLKWEIANLKEGRGSYAKPQGQAHAEFIASTKAEIAALQRREPEQEPDCRHEYSRLGGTGWWQCKICYHETDSPSFRIGARDRKREPVNPPRCTACGQSLSSFHPHVCKEA